MILKSYGLEDFLLCRLMVAGEKVPVGARGYMPNWFGKYALGKGLRGSKLAFPGGN